MVSNKTASKHFGMSLIEVMVAMVILATGILGAVAMQASAKKSSFDAMQRSLASSLAQDIIERMRSNSANSTVLALYDGTYGAVALTAPSNRCNTAANLCTSAQLATNDLFEWSQLIRGADAMKGTSNAGGLVEGIGCITATGQVVTIVITWKGRTETQDARTGSCGSSTADKQRRQLSMTTFLF